jgi:hypothetical protein
MKKFLFIFLFLLLLGSFSIDAQNIVKSSPVANVTNTFAGGGIVIGGGSHNFQIGLNPELVKSYNQYVDGGLAMNIYYETYKDIYDNVQGNNFKYGIGAFTRIWPVETFFIQIQPEYNWAWMHQKDLSTGVSGTQQLGASSLLTGLGYGHKNEGGFTYFSIMIDLLNNPGSPYYDVFNKKQPIFRAGIGLPIRLGDARRKKNDSVKK